MRHHVYPLLQPLTKSAGFSRREVLRGAGLLGLGILVGGRGESMVTAPPTLIVHE